MVDAIIGCPTANRSWILPIWKDHVDAAIPSDWNVKFVFVVPEWDIDSIELISTWPNSQIIPSSEIQRDDTRIWGNLDSYNHMTDLRNTILRYVRKSHPDIYLSLDSDILIDSDTIKNMYETMNLFEANAVGGSTYLDPIDHNCTNVATWKDPVTHQEYRRISTDGVCQVDIIMAIQMMDNLAYNINYEYHNMGEDFGWCVGLQRSKAKIYFDGRAKNKHVMSKDWLDRVDSRVGF